MVATNTTLIIEDNIDRSGEITQTVWDRDHNTTCILVTNITAALREILTHGMPTRWMIINTSVALEWRSGETITQLPSQPITGKKVSEVFAKLQKEKPGKRLSIPDFFDILRVLYPDLLTRQALIPCLPVLLHWLSPKANEQAKDCGESMYWFQIFTREEVGGEKDTEVVQNFLAKTKR